MDCEEYMKAIPDKFFDIAVVDPPYGLNKKSTHGSGKLKARSLNKGNIHLWDIRPEKEYFTELFRVSKNQIIWGGNYFPLPPTRGIIFWDKIQPWENFSQFELAWTSFDKPAAMIRLSTIGGASREKKVHPTQKPKELYHWLFNKYAVPGDKILDTHLGSGSSRIVAYKMGFDFYGTEINKEYFDAQEKRFREQCFGEIETVRGGVVQTSLF